MENDILDSLLDIKYQGPMNNAENLRRAVEIGPKSIDYTRLVSYIATELKQLCNLEEAVNPIHSPDDSSSFLMEVSSFLKELGCPYTALITGHLSDRLNKTSDKLLLIDFLLSELMAARMNKINKPDTNKMEIEISESETAKYLKELLMTLQFNKPPPNITPAMLFQKVEGKLRDVVNRAGPALTGRPAFTKSLTEKQWIALQEIQNSMNKEYKIRREMLLKRVDVTIQSFQWSDKTKGKEEHIKSVYGQKIGSLGVEPGIDLSDLLAARDDITIIEKTSSASVRKNTQSSVNKVIIGRVPDRGGRPSEQAPPPPEMPSWQQRSGGPGGGRGGGGRGGGNQTQGNNFSGQGRGGYGGQNQTGYGGQNQTGYSGQNQSGYSNQSQSGYGGHAQSQGSYGDQGRGGYNDRRGDYNRDSTGQGSYGGPNRNQGGFGGPNRNSSGGSFGGGQRGDYYGGGGGSARGGGGYQSGNQGNQYTSYADQYVQDSYQNQQSGRRGSGGGNQRGQGRSNYNRGGYR